MKSNSFLWIILILLNIVIILLGISLLTLVVYLLFKIKKLTFIVGFLLTIAIILIISNLFINLVGKFKSYIISIGIIINGITFLAVTVFSIMITINFDNTINFILESSEFYNIENIKSFLQEYFLICIILGFSLTGIILFDIIFLILYRKSMIDKKENERMELTIGDSMLIKLKGLEDTNL